MCDCPCKCSHLKPVKPRVSNTFIHTDIFNYQKGHPLNVKCEQIPGQLHNCRCSNIWEKDRLKDTRYRPRDHPSDHFYNQDLGTSQGCCHNTCEYPPVQNQKQLRQQVDNCASKGKQYHYAQDLPAAGQFNGQHTAVHRNPTRCGGRIGIHTGETINYDGHSCHKDVWFNDEKEKEFGKLNHYINRCYSANRKQLEMSSNAFDFIEGEDCCCSSYRTGHFRTSRYENDCQQPVSRDDYPIMERVPNIQRPIEGKKIQNAPKVTFKQTSATDSKGNTKVSNKQQATVSKKVKQPAWKPADTQKQVKQAETECECKCQCWKTKAQNKN